MCFWNKKKEVKVPRKPIRVLVIPEGDAEEVMILWDESKRREPANKHARYLLWKKLESLFPEIVEGEWKLRADPPAHPVLIETLNYFYD